MKILSAGNTDKGKTRKNNEDSFLLDQAGSLYAVADGIGGHSGGEVASRLAVETLREVMQDRRAGKDATPPYGLSPDAAPALSALTYAFRLANIRLLEAGTRDPNLAGMGTTMTAVLLKGKTACLAHIGDSRAYLLRGGALEQITEDHGVVAEQVRAGLIRPDQAKKSPYRHIITRALGIDREVVADHRTIEARQGDLFLLCTDGLTEMVEDREIEGILKRSGTPARAVEKLIRTANEHGGVDNITVIAVKIDAL